MRARNIKPGFFKNEELAELEPLARILFEGLWCMADREGRLEDRPKRIKAEVLPYDNKNVRGLLDKLEDAGFIHRYGGDPPCISIPTFRLHQNPHPNEKPSVLPAPGDITKLQEDSSTKTEALGLIPSSLNPSSLIPDMRISEEAVDGLMAIAATIKSSEQHWKPSKADRATLAAMTERFPLAQVRTELLKFKAYCPQRDYTQFGRAFANWMSRVAPEVTNKTGRVFTPAEESSIAAALEVYRTGDYAAAQEMVSDELWVEVMRRSKG